MTGPSLRIIGPDCADTWVTALFAARFLTPTPSDVHVEVTGDAEPIPETLVGRPPIHRFHRAIGFDPKVMGGGARPIHSWETANKTALPFAAITTPTDGYAYTDLLAQGTSLGLEDGLSLKELLASPSATNPAAGIALDAKAYRDALARHSAKVGIQSALPVGAPSPQTTLYVRGEGELWSSSNLRVGLAALPTTEMSGLLLHIILETLTGVLTYWSGVETTLEERQAYAQYVEGRRGPLADMESLGGGMSGGLSDAVAHRVALYRANGHVPRADYDPFHPDEWRCALEGCGIYQTVPTVRAASLDKATAEHLLARAVGGNNNG